MNTILSQQRDFQSSQLEIKRLNDLLVAVSYLLLLLRSIELCAQSRRAEADKDARLDAMRYFILAISSYWLIDLYRRTIEDISVEARQRKQSLL